MKYEDLNKYKNYEDLKNFTEKLMDTTVSLQNELNKTKDKLYHLEEVTKVENVEFVIVDELDSTNRGEGGFGSTDTKSTEQPKQTMKNIADLYEKISGNITTPSKKYVDSIKERERQLG